MKQRGIFEKVRGSGIWWIHWYDAQGIRHREKVGTKSAALALYRKRKTEVLEGRKLPEKLRRAPAAFCEIAQQALEYSRTYKVPAAYKGDCWMMKIILGWFGGHAAASVTSLTYQLAIRNGKVRENPARLVPHRREDNARLRFLSKGGGSRFANQDSRIVS